MTAPKLHKFQWDGRKLKKRRCKICGHPRYTHPRIHL